ncbi:MAG: hypothetical protein V3V08_06280 [Nannocystaceae bacterium]
MAWATAAGTLVEVERVNRGDKERKRAVTRAPRWPMTAWRWPATPSERTDSEPATKASKTKLEMGASAAGKTSRLKQHHVSRWRRPRRSAGAMQVGDYLVRVGDRLEHPHGTAALRTGFHINSEHPGEQFPPSNA